MARARPSTGLVRFGKGVAVSHPAGLLTFVETATFTRLIREVVSDDDYAAFQLALARHPEQGDLLEGCGGVRKVRMAAGGRSKSGGARSFTFSSATATASTSSTSSPRVTPPIFPRRGKKAIHELAQQIKREAQHEKGSGV